MDIGPSETATGSILGCVNIGNLFQSVYGSRCAYYAARRPNTQHRRHDKLVAMCLILLAVQHDAQYPVVIAANRDEFYQRPTRAAHYWEQQPHIFAGRDLQANGTWMGVTRTGRFAAVTNVREAPSDTSAQWVSRGNLCSDYLNSTMSAQDYLQQLHPHKNQYAGFNLIVGELFCASGKPQLFYYGNRNPHISAISEGVHGLSNGTFNEPWPKVEHGRRQLSQQLEHHKNLEDLHNVLLDSTVADDNDLPNTGVDLATEKWLSSRFIQSPDYGTRTTTVLRINRQQQIEWLEQHFDSDGVLEPAQLTIIDTGN